MSCRAAQEEPPREVVGQEAPLLSRGKLTPLVNQPPLAVSSLVTELVSSEARRALAVWNLLSRADPAPSATWSSGSLPPTIPVL